MGLPRRLFTEEHEAYRENLRRFLDREVVPHYARWSEDGIIPRHMFQAAARHGFLNMSIPEEYGGAGIDDFRFNVIISEECQRAAVPSFLMGLANISNVSTPYFLSYCDESQRRRWLPDMARGDVIVAIAMTEPSGGSDLAALKTTALRDGDHYIVNGAKTFITNGINADLAMTAVRTDPTQKHDGISLLVIERDTPGFERGRKLDKLGLHAQDTAELFFSDARVPVANRLGAEGRGFKYMMSNLPQERLSLAVTAVSAARAALGWTLAYVKERTAFGQPIGSFQNSRMVLAELRTEIEIGQVFVDRCIEALQEKTLTGEQAAMAKWWMTELQGKVVDRCVQLHGGYGYMSEFPITRAYADARITRIFGGTTEIMKEIIGRADGLR
jgi:long-chain-acyl-CoA dehydrogenase